jgi:hypothetical protein
MSDDTHHQAFRLLYVCEQKFCFDKTIYFPVLRLSKHTIDFMKLVSLASIQKR